MELVNISAWVFERGMSTDSQWQALTFSAKNQSPVKHTWLSLWRLLERQLPREHHQSPSTWDFKFFEISNSILLKQDHRTDVQGKGSIFRLKWSLARNFFQRVLLNVRTSPNTWALMGLSIVWKLSSRNISKTTSPSLFITYMYIIHVNMKNKSYYDFETKKGPFSFSLLSAPWLNIFENFFFEEVVRIMGYRMQLVRCKYVERLRRYLASKLVENLLWENNMGNFWPRT